MMCGLEPESEVECEYHAVDGFGVVDANVAVTSPEFIGGLIDGISNVDADFECTSQNADARAKLTAELEQATVLIDVVVAVVDGGEGNRCCNDAVDVERTVIEDVDLETCRHWDADVDEDALH